MKPLISEAQLAGIRQRIIEVMEPALKDIYSGPFGDVYKRQERSITS